MAVRLKGKPRQRRGYRRREFYSLASRVVYKTIARKSTENRNRASVLEARQGAKQLLLPWKGREMTVSRLKHSPK